MREYRCGSNRVVRGGSWDNNAFNCTVSNRNYNTPDNRNDNLGFRLVLVP
ncbi:MAG: SUMF1/EgtB/PvdO family nonheme iron enzyme [Bacteroidales bacterium]|nr:SUMF1/EgtB/PvdO family nonheme iron enzyme [Bacteroidales bacterium]